MICSKKDCGGELRVTHTYTVIAAKFQRAACERCGLVHRLTTTAQPAEARGEGAKAHANRRLREVTRSEPFHSPF